MITVYQIASWDANFENNKSRDVDECSFVAMPNKQHGMGLTRILSLTDGGAVFGVWCLILQAASRQPRPRCGWLTDDGTAASMPWDAEDMALRWRRPVEEICRALEVLCSAKVGWIVAHQISDEAPPPPAPKAPLEPDFRPGAGAVPSECRPGAAVVSTHCPPTTLEGKKERREGKEDARAPVGTPTAPHPPVDLEREKTRAHARRELRKVLVTGGCRSGQDQIEEWVLLLEELFAGTGHPAAVQIDAVERAIRQGKRDGKPIQWAREGADFVRQWVSKLTPKRQDPAA